MMVDGRRALYSLVEIATFRLGGFWLIFGVPLFFGGFFSGLHMILPGLFCTAVGVLHVVASRRMAKSVTASDMHSVSGWLIAVWILACVGVSITWALEWHQDTTLTVAAAIIVVAESCTGLLGIIALGGAASATRQQPANDGIKVQDRFNAQSKDKPFQTCRSSDPIEVFTTLSDWLHDMWFSIEDVVIDHDTDSIQLPLAEDTAEPITVILMCEGVENVDIDDHEKVGFYDINYLVLGKDRKRLRIKCNIPVGITIHLRQTWTLSLNAPCQKQFLN